MCHVRYLQRLLRLLIFAFNAALSSPFGVNRINRFVLSLPPFSDHRDDVSMYHKSCRSGGVKLNSNTLSDHGTIAAILEGEDWYNSHIASIRAYNLAGVVNQGDDKVISIEFGNCPNLVAVTGETGSGKSLLVAKLADLVTGGKATASLLPTPGDDDVAIIEMEIELSQPHLSYVQKSLETIGLDSAQLFGPTPTAASLKLRRVLSIAGPSMKGGKSRLKSVCEINGRPVSLKDLKIVASPLVAIVDASAAAMALAKPKARMAVIDSAVPSGILSEVRQMQKKYRACREHREKLENELANRALPPSIAGDGEQDLVLLKHWVDELDAFQDRMAIFCDSVDQLPKTEDSFGESVTALATVSWHDNAVTQSFSSLMYSRLLDFREAVKLLDLQLESARLAFENLGSLSSPQSAMTALDRARSHLFDVTANENLDGRLSLAAETTHDLLNTVEEYLRDCLKSLEDDRKGILGMLENTRDSVAYNVEDIDLMISDWNALARKHGMPPYALPSCHAALQSELNGNVEARLLLPKAIAEEKAAHDSFEIACVALSKVRQNVGNSLSASVSKRMPSLGLEGSKFEVQTRSDVRKCSDFSCYAASGVVGLDALDFWLIHESNDAVENQELRGGKIDVVASSGEKARLLLAIECEIPGAIGASCRIANEDDDAVTTHNYPPIAVLYDEIDAHVGGRAAVAMGNMLADQSRKGKGSNSRGQIISITHTPSVAAMADVHLVIQKQKKSNGEKSVSVTATLVDGSSRRKELARMASGDLAPDEAEAFADALLRDGAIRRISN